MGDSNSSIKGRKQEPLISNQLIGKDIMIDDQFFGSKANENNLFKGGSKKSLKNLELDVDKINEEAGITSVFPNKNISKENQNTNHEIGLYLIITSSLKNSKKIKFFKDFLIEKTFK